MNQNKLILKDFLKKYQENNEVINEDEFIKNCIDAMNQGLIDEKSSKLPMFPSFIHPFIQPILEEPVLLIDMGGTNIRIALGLIDKQKRINIEFIYKGAMIGLDQTKHYTKELFFEELYDLIEKPIQDKNIKRIGIVFSYAAIITPSLDGILESWSKEINIPDMINCNINQEIRTIIKDKLNLNVTCNLINDTVATLLGKRLEDYCESNFEPNIGYLGLIYGTGFNICYCEQVNRIDKIKELKLDYEEMIINTEIANFDGFTFGVFDKRVFVNTEDETMGRLEKITSGRYLSELINQALLQCYQDKLINELIQFKNLEEISHYYMENKNAINNEKAFVILLIDFFINRSARLIALTVLSVLFKGYSEATKKDNKIKLVCEGSTYFCLPSFRETFLKEINKMIDNKNLKLDIEESFGESLNLKGALLASAVDNH